MRSTRRSLLKRRSSWTRTPTRSARRSPSPQRSPEWFRMKDRMPKRLDQIVVRYPTKTSWGTTTGFVAKISGPKFWLESTNGPLNAINETIFDPRQRLEIQQENFYTNGMKEFPKDVKCKSADLRWQYVY